MSNTPTSKVEVLSPVMKLNIGILSGVGLISIILLLFGTFEYKASRIILTLFLFTIFTIIAGLDSRLTSMSPVKLAISQTGNVLALCLALIATWGGAFGWSKVSEYNDFYSMSAHNGDSGPAFFPILGILIVVKLGVLAAQAISQQWNNGLTVLAVASRVGSIATAITAFMLSLPLALMSFIDFDSSWYWKITAAFTLVAGLSTAIMLLVWAVTREKPVPMTQEEIYTYQQSRMTQAKAVSDVPMPYYNQPHTAPTVPQQFTKPVNNIPPVPERPTTEPQNLLPWPLLPNGLPVPALTNGLPDFDALQKALDTARGINNN